MVVGVVVVPPFVDLVSQMTGLHHVWPKMEESWEKGITSLICEEDVRDMQKKSSHFSCRCVDRLKTLFGCFKITKGYCS